LYGFVRWLAHVAFVIAYRVRISGHARIPRAGALLLVCNHQSNLDPPAVASSISSRHIEFLAKEELFSGLLGKLIANLNAVPIRESGGDAAAIKEILRRLGEGRAVLVFPEGTRTEDGAMHEFKRGVAVLVKRSRCPVQPVAVEGCFDAWPRGQSRPRIRGRCIAVAFGQPIDHEELMKDGPDAALERLALEVDALRLALRAELRCTTNGRYPPPGLGDRPISTAAAGPPRAAEDTTPSVARP
jgi:1-acyl-sn-glycerol-3-phosphate acyltransferase